MGRIIQQMWDNSNCTRRLTKYHVIVFSFNRAMQCESVLRSILHHVKTPRLTVSVVWRATGPHIEGYSRLKEMYVGRGVSFHEQFGKLSFRKHVFPRLWMPRNLYHWLKFDYIRRADNFKPLLEKLIADTPADFVSFNTDDNIYYRDEVLPDTAFAYVRNHPYAASYRVLQGGNLTDCPTTVSRGAEYLKWDYYAPGATSTWAYPFAVDGQFFERSALLRVVRRVLYHNPVTLESYTVGYVKRRRLFRWGYGPVHGSMLAVPLNKVSFIVPGNTRGDLSIEDLNAFFLGGFTLEYDLPTQVNTREVIPGHVTAVRGDERMVLPVYHV